MLAARQRYPRGERALDLFGLDQIQRGEAFQDPNAAALHALEAALRIVQRGPARDRSERGRLREIERPRRFVEVALARRLHPAKIRAELDASQVLGQDGLLVELALDA